MWSLEVNDKMQREAVIAEFTRAYMDGNFSLARDIRRANPDIWPVKVEDWNESNR